MTRPDFTGTWTFDPSRSRLQIPAPESSVFVIHHDEPRFQLERTHVVGGKVDTLSLELMTGGAPVVTMHDGLETRSTLRWEGDALVLVSEILGEASATNTVRYRLQSAGRVLVAEERLRSSQINYENVWVFSRSSSSG